MSTPTATVPGNLPNPDALTDSFQVYEVEVDDEAIRYYGEPLDAKETVVQRLAPRFRDRGYRIDLRYETGEHVLVATERSLSVDTVPWTNLALFAATVVTTLLAGARWYGLPISEQPLSLLAAWPFALSVLSVLAIHELGHYALSRHHQVEASLPYFIPLPNLLGTLGALIRMNDHIPDRDALFDIGVAGPLAGLVATVVVTAIGVSLPPIEMSGSQLVQQTELGYPLLLQGIAAVLGQPLSYSDPSLMVNPVVIGGWVGAFVTFLNLLPVGQLDGAHVTRALVGDRMSVVQKLVPAVLFSLAGGLLVFADGQAAFIWVLWGFFALLLSRVPGAEPLDQSSVGPGRQAIGALTLVLGLLCFTPIPIVISV